MARVMTAAEVRQLGETQAVEFKKTLAEQKDGVRALCGMLNTDASAGVVVFGVAPDGTIAGLDGNLDSGQRSLRQFIAQKVDPPAVNLDLELVTCDGATLLLLSALRPKSVPYHEFDGRTPIREGSETRDLKLAEKQRLARLRDRSHHQGPWRCDRCGAFCMMLVAGTFKVGPGGTTYEPGYACQCGGEYWPAV